MIYKFRIISDEIKEFAREMLIQDSSTFLDFHHCLQENLVYDPKQLASFFITNQSWEKKVQITLIDMMDEESENVLIMENEKLGNHITKQGDRLLYIFDFFSERSFFIELTEVINIPDKNTAPKIIFSHGEAPEQINLGLTTGISEEDFGAEFNMDNPDDDYTGEIDFMDIDDIPEE